MFSGFKTFNILVALSSTSPALQHWSLVNDFGLGGIFPVFNLAIACSPLVDR